MVCRDEAESESLLTLAMMAEAEPAKSITARARMEYMVKNEVG